MITAERPLPLLFQRELDELLSRSKVRHASALGVLRRRFGVNVCALEKAVEGGEAMLVDNGEHAEWLHHHADYDGAGLRVLRRLTGCARCSLRFHDALAQLCR